MAPPIEMKRLYFLLSIATDAYKWHVLETAFSKDSAR